MSTSGAVRRCAVLGSPISHSLSPVLHRAAYAELGLDWAYDACEVREDQLAGFLDGLDETWRGLSLTMPLKRAVVPLLDEASARARQAGISEVTIAGHLVPSSIGSFGPLGGTPWGQAFLQAAE